MPEKMSANRARDSRETVRRKRRERTKENLEFYECIRDIVSHPAVLEMKKYYQHCDTDCYEHCLDVAYNNFILLDMICLQIAFLLAYVIRHDSGSPYIVPLYRNMAIFMELLDIVVMFLRAFQVLCKQKKLI